MNPPKESSTKNTKGTNKTAFVRAFRTFRGLYFLPSDQVFDGMFFLRNHLSCRIGKDYGFLVLTIRMHNAKMIHVM